MVVVFSSIFRITQERNSGVLNVTKVLHKCDFKEGPANCVYYSVHTHDASGHFFLRTIGDFRVNVCLILNETIQSHMK